MMLELWRPGISWLEAGLIHWDTLRLTNVEQSDGPVIPSLASFSLALQKTISHLQSSYCTHSALAGDLQQAREDGWSLSPAVASSHTL